MIYDYTKSNIEEFSEKLFLEVIQERSPVIWGMGEIGVLVFEKIRSILGEKQKIYYVDNEIKEKNSLDISCITPDEMINQNQKYYIIITASYYVNIEEKLWSLGYQEWTDYCYLRKLETKSPGRGVYRDLLGNELRGFCDNKNIKVLGHNSKVFISSPTYINAEIIVGYNSTLYIGSNVTLNGIVRVIDNSTLIINDGTYIGASITVEKDSHINIGKGIYVKEGILYANENSSIEFEDHQRWEGITRIIALSGSSIRWCEYIYSTGYKYIRSSEESKMCIGAHAELIGDITINSEAESILNIGKQFSLSSDSEIYCHHNSSLILGDENRFHHQTFITSSYNSSLLTGDFVRCNKDISIFSGESHPVFDVDRPSNGGKSGKVEIGNHVWLARGVSIFSNTTIADGCMVGFHSIVKGNFSNNCMILGNPAKIVKSDFAWGFVDDDYTKHIEKSYWNKTVLEQNQDKKEVPNECHLDCNAFELISKCVKEITGNDDIVITEEMYLSDLEDWDSLYQIQFVEMLERRLDIHFQNEDMLNFDRVSQIQTAILSKMGKKERT